MMPVVVSPTRPSAQKRVRNHESRCYHFPQVAELQRIYVSKFALHRQEVQKYRQHPTLHCIPHNGKVV